MEVDFFGAEDIMSTQLAVIKGQLQYIKNQLQEDVVADQISFKEYIDPFTGG